MKKLFFLLILLTTFSCSRNLDVNVQPMCTDKTSCVIDLGQYLNRCSSFFESGSKPMKVSITVDGVTFDQANRQVTFNLADAYDFDVNNDDTSPSSRQFTVQLPRCGSYAITIEARGTDGSCFTCCQSGGNTTVPINKACSVDPTNSVSRKGAPKFRVVSASINSDLQNPPPATLSLTPIIVNCSGCRSGC
ncbi:MAG: hypothetical protein RL757_2370 [Bacteroidota bacterium]|jgi:hypothetical protein